MADRLVTQTHAPAIARENKDVASTQADIAVVDCQDLVARCMGNLAFAENILARFEERLDVDLAMLETAIDRPDTEGVARVAHRLKGASANVSANGLHDVFSRLEELARTGQLQELPFCMDELRSEWSRFKQAQALLFKSDGVEGESTVVVND